MERLVEIEDSNKHFRAIDLDEYDIDDEDYMGMQINLWKADGTWHEDDSRDLFETNIEMTNG